MSSLSTIEQLMREIGLLRGLVQVSEREGGGAWHLVLDGTCSLDAEYEPLLDRLVLCGAIGPLPERSRLATCEILLTYNAAWSETGGARMALDADGRTVLMLMDVPAAQIDAGLLAQLLPGLQAIQLAWRQILQQLASDVGANTRPDAPAMHILKA